MSTLDRHQLSPNPWLSSVVAIDAITPEAPGVATYRLGFRDPQAAARYQFRPGQFNMLYLPGVGEIPISLSADPAERTSWPHTIRTAGNVTRALAQLCIGDTLGLRGPFGSSWPLEEIHGRDVILVAGGIGLAPLRPAIYELLRRAQHYGRLSLLYGGRAPASLLYAPEFDAWSRSGLFVQTTVDRAPPGWLGSVGFVNLLLERFPLPRPAQTVILTCGPEVMMRYIVRSALNRGLATDQIWCSLERNMQCAVGLCGHCQLAGEFVCRDGPVFRYDRVQALLAVEGL
jgi:NAD(P)H-flavin reductase